MNLLVVDDHPLVCKGLIALLNSEENIDEIKEASSVDEALVKLLHYKPDITLIDLKLGKEDGIDIVIKARKKDIHSRFIILTSSLKQSDFLRCKKANVDGYILKEAFAEDIIYALHVVGRGKKFFDSQVLQYEELTSKENYLKDLTSREIDVLKEIGNGLSNIEIAHKLFISENTVKKHVSHIFMKLELTHRTQAALLVKENCLDNNLMF